MIKHRFLDSLKIMVKGGNGGMGLPKYGGVGGKGGDVYVQATKKMELITVENMYPSAIASAHRGQDSTKAKIYGEPGKDKFVSVPVGVSVYDAYERKLGDLNNPDQKLLVAAGGYGGSPTTVPQYVGGKGEEKVITLDLKLIADVGLVGFPNAGKSTLLKAISRAKPKIAAYAFTTLKPNLGVVQYPDLRKIQVADLPGLIEGASYDLGMGHKFLKHVERTKMILMVADIQGFQLSPAQKHRNCLETVILLNKELELYKKELVYKPAMLVINKMDLPGAEAKFKEILPTLENLESCMKNVPEKFRPNKVLNFEEILPISAKTDEESANQVKKIVRKVLDKSYMETFEGVQIKRESDVIEEIRRRNSEVEVTML